MSVHSHRELVRRARLERAVLGAVLIALLTATVAVIAIRPAQLAPYSSGIALGLVAVLTVRVVPAVARLVARFWRAIVITFMLLLVGAVLLLFQASLLFLPGTQAPNPPDVPSRRIFYVPYDYRATFDVTDGSIDLVETVEIDTSQVEYEDAAGDVLPISRTLAAPCVDTIVAGGWTYVDGTDRHYQRRTERTYEQPVWPVLSTLDLRVGGFDPAGTCQVVEPEAGALVEVNVVSLEDADPEFTAEAQRHAIVGQGSQQSVGARDAVVLRPLRGLAMPPANRPGVRTISFADETARFSIELPLLAGWARAGWGQTLAGLTPQGAVARSIGFLVPIVAIGARERIVDLVKALFQRSRDDPDTDNGRPEGDAGYR